MNESDLRSQYQATFRTPAGQIVLRDLIGCIGNQATRDSGWAFCAGQQDIVLRILDCTFTEAPAPDTTQYPQQAPDWP